MKNYFLFSVIIFSVFNLKAQLILLNQGAYFGADKGAYVYVKGNVHNSSSGEINIAATGGNQAEIKIDNNFTNDATAGGDGIFRVAGDWINNNTFNSGTGTVFLDGANQIIGGSVSTSFYNLTLEGTGIKTQAINQTVTNILKLNDRELATESFTMYVTNTNNVNAVQRTTGFVSSLGNGLLSRNTLSALSYLFPVGSSVGTFRYRPIEIVPLSASANTYTVRMANVDATGEGYDRDNIVPEICETNPLFYHRINRTDGTSAVDMYIKYEPGDGNWEGIANYKSASTQWEVVVGSYTDADPKAIKLNWNDFSNTPYILYSKLPDPTILTTDLGFCADETVPNFVAQTGGGTWSGPGISPTGAFNPSAAGAGTHQIIYSITGICPTADTVSVDVYPVPTLELGNDTVVCEGATIPLNAGAGFTYLWSTTETTQTINVTSPGLYAVTVSDGKCYNYDDVDVSFEYCGTPHAVVPSVFSPNGDGENDILFVRGDGIKKLEFIVYSRWGEQVFVTTNKDIGWDGTFRGQPLNPAVFVYYLGADFVTGETLKKYGDVTLIK